LDIQKLPGILNITYIKEPRAKSTTSEEASTVNVHYIEVQSVKNDSQVALKPM